MRIVCQTFSLPKEGREFSDYEDACFPSSPVNIASHVEAHAQTETFRTAVCDGATDSCFSKFWAQLLASSYGSGEWSEDVSEKSLVAAQASWKDYVSRQDLPWYAEEKVKLGAFAAFIGLTLFADKQEWRSVAIGDCCLFHTRNGQLIDCFPLSKTADFNNFPYLLGSLKERNDSVFDQKQTRMNGHWDSGDIFLLMSDALACWFLRCVEGGAGNQLVAWLTQLNNHEHFSQLVHAQRTELGADSLPNMKDDDVTLVKIWVGDNNTALPAVQGRAAAADTPGQSRADAEDPAAVKAARRGTSERAATRQTRGELPESAKTPPAVAKGLGLKRRGPADLESEEPDTPAGSSFRSRGKVGDAAQITARRSALIFAGILLVLGLVGLVVWQHNQTKVNASAKVPDTVGSGTAALKQNAPPVSDNSQTEADSIASVHGKHGKNGHGKRHGMPTPTLSVPLEDLPIKTKKGLDMVPDHGDQIPNMQNLGSQGKSRDD